MRFQRRNKLILAKCGVKAVGGVADRLYIFIAELFIELGDNIFPLLFPVFPGVFCDIVAQFFLEHYVKIVKFHLYSVFIKNFVTVHTEIFANFSAL